MSPSEEQAIQRILKQVDALGLFPQAAMKIHQVASDPESSQRDMERAISLEPALSAQILRLANSPFYGLRRNVSNLRQAIFVLGFRAIQGLAMSLAVMHMGKSAHPARRQAWRHALAVGIAARRFSSRVDGIVPGDAFVSGLLHDIGETLLMAVEGDEDLVILHTDHPHADAWLAAERERFGCDHAVLGAACLESWGLPEGLCEAVRLHHDAAAIAEIEHPTARRLAEIVWLADQVDRARLGEIDLDGLHARIEGAPLYVPQAVGWPLVRDTLDALPDELERLAGADLPSPDRKPKRTGPRRRVSRRRTGGRVGWRKTG